MNSALRYLTQSGMSFGLSFGVTVGLHELGGVPKEVAYAVALCVITLFNFLGFRHFVYRTADAALMKQFLAYLASCAGFRLTEYCTFVVLERWVGVPYTLALVGVQGMSFVLKFFVYRRVVFNAESSSAS